MKILLDTTEEKAQFIGPDMESIRDLSILEKMLTLSSIKTLTIDIQKVLQDNLEESIITTEVLRDWPTYYGQVFQ